ncbi:MAG: prolipoprotein diacylglyceryl transferase [Proteobacteria bacterium]|nr:prolipoprotein diacylglyceryl transferase [Pseudomonadota bacterium]
MIWNALQFPNIDPSALTIPHLFDVGSWHVGPFHLRWYALAYIVGLVLGWRWMVWLIRQDRLWKPNKPSMSVLQADDFLFWATLGVILGGRIGYVIFYMLLGNEESRAKVFNDPATIFRIWEGGMSFHGGFIGVALAALFFTYRVSLKSPRLTPRLHVDEAQFTTLAKKRAVAEPPRDHVSENTHVQDIGWLKKRDVEELRNKARTDKIDFVRLADLAAAVTPIGLFFGRIANFINGELWGRHTNLPWGMIFPEGGYNYDTNSWIWHGTETARHPSQLYEATLEGLVLFAILTVATLRFDSLRRPGLNSGLFLVFYGLSRAVLENVREPDAQMRDLFSGTILQGITMGMLLSIPMILIGAWLINRALKQPKLAAA